MNRRQFFTRLATAAVGVCVASKIPTAWLPSPVRQYAATEFLRRVWNEAAKGSGSAHWPKHLYAGSDLFDAFEGEIIQLARVMPFAGPFTATQYPGSLRFKGSVLHREGRGWSVRVPLADGTEMVRQLA